MEFTFDCNPLPNTRNCDTDDDYYMHSSRKDTDRRSSIPTRNIQQSNQYDESSMITPITTTTISPLRAVISNSPIYHVEQRYETYCRTHIDIVELIKQWQLGRISNFDYLLILNALAGRKFHDPNYHLIFPWINDFTSSITNLRDLSQTKYRLNKGN
jgi:WD repeat-containing protein 81